MRDKLLFGTIGLLVGIIALALACESGTQSQIEGPEEAGASMAAKAKAKDLYFVTRDDSLMIFDVSDLEAITLVSAVPVGWQPKIAREGRALYVRAHPTNPSCQRCADVVIVDITDPSTPLVRDFIDIDPSSEAEVVIGSLQVVGKLLFVPVSFQEAYERGLWIYDISSPLNPVRIR